MSVQQTGVYQRGARIATAFVVALASFTAILPFFLTQNASAATGLLINEISPTSSTEFVELYNPTGVAIDVSGWYFTDAANNTFGSPFAPGTTIEAFGFLAITDTSVLGDNGDETVTLFDTTNTIETSVTYGPNGVAIAPPDTQSLSRIIDGGNVWKVGAPSQGTSNNPIFAAPQVTLEASTSVVKYDASNQVADILLKGSIDDTDRANYTLTASSIDEPLINNGGSASSFEYLWDIKNIPDGTYTITLTAKDMLGNEASTAVNILIDRILPSAPLHDLSNEPPFGGTKDRRFVPIVAGGCSESSCNVLYTANDKTMTLTEDGTLDLQARTPEGSLLYPSGVYEVKATATDTAGNTTTNMTTFIVDNTAPGVTITNTGLSQTGGTIQPDVAVTETEGKTVSYSWLRASTSPNSGALDSSEVNTPKPTFLPKTAGLYRYNLTVCDSLENCSTTQFSFTWEPLAVAIADTAFLAATTTPPPVGLVATQFNTTNPKALGVTTAGSSAQTSSTAAPMDRELRPKAKTVATTYADSSSDRVWWSLLVFALIAAGYYAYRNWQLNKKAKES